MPGLKFTRAGVYIDEAGTHLNLVVSNPAMARTFVAGMKEGKTYVAELKEYRERRSLDANAYSWVLTDKLSEEMVIRGVKLSKDEMHAEMIFRYGQVALDESGCAVVWSSAQEVPVKDFYPYAKEIGEGEVNGKLFKHYKIYRGSSTYDTREMSIFISGIVEECKELGIETATPEELDRMKEAWHA